VVAEAFRRHQGCPYLQIMSLVEASLLVQTVAAVLGVVIVPIVALEER
jgi:hypothetical protein